MGKLSGVGEVVAISIAANEGLGKRQDLLDAEHIHEVEKVRYMRRLFASATNYKRQNVYASTLLYILTIALAKASTLLLISRLATAKLHLRTVQALSGVVISWTIAAIFGSAFQCEMPRPWHFLSTSCFNIVCDFQDGHPGIG